MKHEQNWWQAQQEHKANLEMKAVKTLGCLGVIIALIIIGVKIAIVIGILKALF